MIVSVDGNGPARKALWTSTSGTSYYYSVLWLIFMED